MKNHRNNTGVIYIAFLCAMLISSIHSYSQCSVKLPKDFIECNNSAVSIQSNTDYAPTYSTDDPGDKYFWTVSGGPFTWFGGTSRTDRYPKVNLLDGYIYTIVIRFTNSFGVCSDTQRVYRNVGLTTEITNPVDTTVCFSAQSFDLSATIDGPYTGFSWTSTGSGSFANAGTLSPTYTLSTADKNNGQVKVIFTALANVNGSCHPYDTDTLTINILKLVGTDTSVNLCSDGKLDYQPVVTGANQFSWTSQVMSGSVSGNSPTGTGRIKDQLVNNSSSTDAVVRYTITPTFIGCSGDPYSFFVTVKPIPVITATYSQTICTGTSSNIQVSSSATGTLYTWTSSVLNGNASGNTNASTPVALSSINDILINNSSTQDARVRYIITPQTTFGCTGEPFDAIITLKPQATLSNAGADRIICLKDTIRLSGNVATEGSGIWNQLSGPNTATIDQLTNRNTSVSNLLPGFYRFIWTISNGICAPNRDTVLINISSPVVAGMLPKTGDGCTGSNAGSFTLTNFNGNILRWESTTNNGASWSNISNTTNVQSYSNLTTTTWYRAIVESGACGTVVTDTAVMTVYPLVTPSNAGADRTLCLKDSIHLNANIATSGTGLWSQLSGPNSALINQPANRGSFVTNLQPGVYRFIWTISNNVCPASIDTVTINISTPTTPGTLTGNATVCTASNSGTMVLNSYTGVIINWEFSNNNGLSWSPISNTGNTYTYNNLTTTTWYRTTVQNGACISAFSDTAVVTVLPNVTPANAGANRMICLKDTIRLNANTPVSGTGTWSQLSGPNSTTINQSTDPNTSVTNLQPGTYSFIWTISNGVCAVSRDTVSINISSPVVAGMLPKTADGCTGSNSGSFTLTNFNGNILRWESSTNNGASWSNISNTTNVYNYSNVITTTWYRAIVESGACGFVVTDTAVLTIFALVSPANAGADRILCLKDSIQLNANNPTSGTGLWSQLSGPNSALINQPSNPGSSVTNLQPGIYRFIWTISNNVCPAGRDTVTINISTPTFPGNLTGNANACTGNNSGVLTLNGYTGVIINWEYSTNQGQSWTLISNTNSTYTYNNLTATTWYSTTVQNGACISSFSDTAVIAVFPFVTPSNAGADRIICLQDTITLNANTPVNGTGTWSQLSGPNTATINQPANPSSSVTNLQAGSYSFIWTIGNGVCANSRDTVTINISTPTVAGTITGDATVCTNNNSGTLLLNNYTGNIINWEYSTNNGQSWNNIINTTNNQPYNSLTTTTWYRAFVQSGACAMLASDTAVVTVFPFVTPSNAGSDRTICLQDSMMLNANTPVSGTGTWSQLSGPNTATINQPANPNTSVTSLQAGTYRFVWTIGNGVCANSSDTVSINISTPTIAGTITGDATVCTNNNSGTLVLNNYTGNIINWEFSTNNGQSWNNIINATTSYSYSNLNSTTFYRAAVKSGACPVAFSDTAVITVFQLITPANAGADRNICIKDSIHLAGNTPVNGTGSWRQLSGPSTANINLTSDPGTAVTNLQPGSYSFIWTTTNGVCPADDDTVVISISSRVVAGMLPRTADACSGSNNGSFTLVNFNGNINRWEYSINSGQTWINISNTTNVQSYSNLTATTWYRAFVESGACGIVITDTAVVTVYPTVTPASAGADRNICLQYRINLNGNAPVYGNGTWTQISGPNSSVIQQANDPSTLVTNLRPGTYRYAWTITNNICPSRSDTVTIIISELITNVIDTATKTVCQNTPVTINSLQISGGNGTYQFQWERSYDGITWTLIPGATQATYSFNADTTVYLRRYVSSAPCSSVSEFIRVNVQQSIGGNTIQANQTLCYGDNASEITGSTPAGGNGTYNYTWQQSIDGGTTWITIASGSAKNYTPISVLQTTLYRRIVESGSCTGIYSLTSNQVLITVNPLSKAAFTVTTPIACAPFLIDSTNIKVVRHNKLNKDYFWYANNNLIGTGAAFPGYTLTQAQDSVVIKLRVTSLYNCKDDSTEYVLRVIPFPKPAFQISDSIGCALLTVSFTNQTPLASQYNYQWDFGNGQTSTQHTPANITFTGSNTKTDTTYIITLTAFNNCDTVSVTKSIHVRSIPKATFTPVPASGCSPLLVNFYIKINSTNSKHHLFFGDGTDTLITASSQFSHVYKTNVTKNFNPKLISSNECGADSFSTSVQAIAIDADLKFDIIDTAGCAPHNISIINRSTGTVNYTWSLGDGTPARAASVNDTIKYTYNLPGVYPVKLTARHQCGDTSMIRNVYVHAVPDAAFTVTNGSACIGDTLKFTNSSSNATSYSWSFGDGGTSSTFNPSHSYTAARRYDISLTSARVYATGVTCSDIMSSPVNIVDHLPGNMFVSDTTGVCLPFSVTFINRTQPSETTTWNFGDGTSGTGDTITHVYTSGGIFTASMNAQSAGGCVYTDTTTITVKPTDGSLSFISGPYCGNNNIRFTATLQNTDSLVWHFGDGSVLHTTDTIVYHSYEPGSYLPWAELIGKEGCRKTIKGADSIRVEKLKAGFQWATTNNCGNSIVQFIDTSRSFYGVQQYQWSFGDGTTGTGKTLQHQYNIAGTYQVRLIITGVAGCTDTITRAVTVAVHNYPVVNIQNNNNACVFAPHQFASNVQSADSVSSYRWDMGAGRIIQGVTATSTYTTAGTFNVQLIAGTIYGCYDTAVTSVTVHPAPILLADKQLQICRGQQVVLRASNATTATWANNQQTICTGCTQTTVSPVSTTKYYVTGSSQYGCTSRDTVTVNVIQPFDMRVSLGDTLCIGEQIQIFSSGAAACTWYPAAGLSKTDVANPIAKPLVTTTYTVVGQDAYNCFTDTGNVTIVVGPPSQIRLGEDTIVVGGTSIVLKSIVTNGIASQYRWTSPTNLSCSNCPQPVAAIKKDECFTSTITNQYGCVSSDTICIKTFCKSAQVFIPNAFSPDNDGVNDMFYVMGSGIKIVKNFMIFNRWGELIFQKENFNVNDVSKGWNGMIRGQKAPPEVYVYVCNVLCENDVPYSYKGNVAIIK